MKRLTMRNEEGTASWTAPSCPGGGYRLNRDLDDTQRLDRLVAYEDTMPLERAQELAQAEKDGRLVVLPVKSDEIVYKWKNGDDIPSLFRLNGVSIGEDMEITYKTHWGETLTPDDFGKTIFLTREEAEVALKKREADDEAD